MKRFRDLREHVLDMPTHSPETLAKKHGVSVDHIHAQLKKGIEVEHEHTSDSKIAREIALDHLGEKPDYYAKLDKAGLEEAWGLGVRHTPSIPALPARTPNKGRTLAGMSLQQAVAHAKEHGNKVAYGTNSRKWHSIDPADRDFTTPFSYDPHDAKAIQKAAKFWDPKAKLEEGHSDTFNTVRTVKDTMKKFKELTEGLSHKVPVYHADRKTLVGHVSSGATSIGAAKLAKKKSAIFSRVNGEYSWVASGDLKESAEMTERERLSHGERMKPKENPPIDRAQKIKQELTKHDNANDSVRKNLAQGGVDSSSHKTLRLKEGVEQLVEVSLKLANKVRLARMAKGDKLRDQNIQRVSGATLPKMQAEYDKATTAGKYITKRWGWNSVKLTEGSDLPFHKYTNDELDAAIKYHADSATELRRFDRKSHAAYQHVQHAHAAREILKSRKRNLTESAESYKVGDKVIPKIGPHKGTVHTVIHVHPTGHLNIKPDVHVRSNRYHLGAAKADPKDVERAPVSEGFKQYLGYSKDATGLDKKGSPERNARAKEFRDDREKGAVNSRPYPMRRPSTGINRKTVQEAFQAAKDKKNGKQDNLPQSQEGANEPGKEKIAAAEPQPQGGDAPKTQDGGQPGAQQKKDNAPKPEASKNAKKLVPKGGEQFQSDPFVTPLTTMPDTAAPKSGSQGVR